MVKQTKGYILLVLLVITGLASQVPKQTLTGKERKNLTTHLKDSKAAFLLAIQDLSPEQLSFTPDNYFSIKHIIQQQAFTEKMLWQIADSAVERTKSNNEYNKPNENVFSQNVLITNGQLLDPTGYKNAQKFSAERAQKIFAANRNKLIKYVKTTTDDARHHWAQTPLGQASIYQTLIAAADATTFYIEQINAIKSDPHFPK